MQFCGVLVAEDPPYKANYLFPTPPIGIRTNRTKTDGIGLKTLAKTSEIICFGKLLKNISVSFKSWETENTKGAGRTC